MADTHQALGGTLTAYGEAHQALGALTRLWGDTQQALGGTHLPSPPHPPALVPPVPMN